MCMINYVAICFAKEENSVADLNFAVLYLPLGELEQSCNPNVYLNTYNQNVTLH